MIEHWPFTLSGKKARGRGFESRRAHMKILKNKAKCKKCEDVIESEFVHDYKTCSCGAIAVDGGHEYLKRVGKPDLIKDFSEVKAE